MKLSEHFDSSEFACKCGCGGLNNGAGVNPRLVQVLERMRQLCGSPLELSCAYRCPKHVYGIAADVQTPPGLTPEELLRVAEQAGADGIGLYTWGVHVDVRGYAARW